MTADPNEAEEAEEAEETETFTLPMELPENNPWYHSYALMASPIPFVVATCTRCGSLVRTETLPTNEDGLPAGIAAHELFHASLGHPYLDLTTGEQGEPVVGRDTSTEGGV